MDVNTQMITIHPRISVLIYFIYTNMNNRIIVNHPRCKHHPKIPTRVTPLYIQSFTTIHKKIHPYALVHKSLPRQPATWLLLHFLHSYIINMQTHFVTSFTKIHKFLTTWQHHVTFLKTQDGDVPTTRGFFPSPLNTHCCTSTLKRHPKLLKYTEASLFDVFPTVIFLAIEIWVSSLKYCDKLKPLSCALILCITLFSPQFLMSYGQPTTILEYSAGIMRDTMIGHIDSSPLRTMSGDVLLVLCKIMHRYHQVNPWDCTISWVIRCFSANHLGQKLINTILQIEYSRSGQVKSHYTWWTYLPMAATTLNMLSWKILNILFILFIIKKHLCANLPDSQIFLSCDCHRFIHKIFHKHKYLLLRYFASFYIKKWWS